ncbi:protein kinase [Daldinia grandis]|nr:protein kinase [Daldinia grandis]
MNSKLSGNSKEVNNPPTSTPSPGGILTINLHEAVGLSVTENYKEHFNGEKHNYHGEGRPRVCRRRNYTYALLDYEKSQATLDCYWGTIESPVWSSQFAICKFNVSSFSELAIYLYIRDPDRSLKGQDVCLGVARVNPFDGLEKSEARWLELQDGTGKLLISFEYTNPQNRTLDEVDFERGIPTYGVWTSGVIKKDTQRVYAESKVRTTQLNSKLQLKSIWDYQVSHPFIAPLSFAFESSKGLTLLSPYVGGGPLFSQLQKDRCFDIDRSRLYAAEITCALEYLHGTRKVFSWLKPRNILLDLFGHVVLCGFGLFNSDVKNGNHGTSEYPAPELLLGHVESTAADWWTLGVVLYEMLIGLPPFYDDDHNKIRQRILSQPVWFPDPFPPIAKDVITKLLDRDYGQRLGANEGALEVKSHPFFDGVDWNKLLQRKYTPIFRPEFTSSSFQQYGMNDYPKEKDDFVSRWMTSLDYTKGLGTSTSPVWEAYQEPIRVDDGWELIWDEARCEFDLYNRFTQAKKPVPSRYVEPPKHDNTAASEGVEPAVPSQTQKQDVLEEALQVGHDRVILQLLEYGMDLNIRIGAKRESPLEWATEEGSLPLVRLFLSKGADANFPSFTDSEMHKGGPALVRAVEKGSLEIVQALVQVTGRVASTRALGLAVCRQDIPTVKLLLESGVRCEFKESDRPLPWDPEDDGCYFFDRDEPEEFIPPLVRAVKKGNADLVRLLLSHGADANASYHSLHWDLDEYNVGKDPIWFSCAWPVELAMELGHQEIVELLLDNGADINLPQPSWPVPGHHCGSVPRLVYQKVTVRLRATVAAKHDGEASG